MKTNELRIGSWVIVKPFTQTIGDITMSQERPQTCQITCIQKMGDSAVVQVNDNIIAPIPIEHIMGIPLSEKILKKAGFDDSAESNMIVYCYWSKYKKRWLWKVYPYWHLAMYNDWVCEMINK